MICLTCHTLRRPLLSAVFLLACVFFSPFPAQACKFPPPDAEQSRKTVERAVAIVEASVESAVTKDDKQTLTLRVLKTYKWSTDLLPVFKVVNDLSTDCTTGYYKEGDQGIFIIYSDELGKGLRLGRQSESYLDETVWKELKQSARPQKHIKQGNSSF